MDANPVEGRYLADSLIESKGACCLRGLGLHYVRHARVTIGVAATTVHYRARVQTRTGNALFRRERHRSEDVL